MSNRFLTGDFQDAFSLSFFGTEPTRELAPQGENRSGDYVQQSRIAPDSPTDYRSDALGITEKYRLPATEDYWAGFSLYFGEGYEDTAPGDEGMYNGVAFGTHYYNSDSPTTSGPTQIQLKNGQMQFISEPIHGASGYYYTEGLRIREWIDLVWHCRTDDGSTGLIEIWLDGVKVVSAYGSNHETGMDHGSYAKWGTYTSALVNGDWPNGVTEFITYFDQVRIGGDGDGFYDVQPMRSVLGRSDSYAIEVTGLPPELSNPQNTPEPDGATLTIDSNSAAGTLYSYSKTTPFTGTEAEKAAEIMASGFPQVPVLGTNTRVVTGQDTLTDHYAGWVQDSEGYGADLAMEFNMGAGETLTIPGGAGAYLFDIDWGDGTVETGLTTQGAGPHTYTDAIEAVVRVSGTFPHVYFNNAGDIGKLIRILNWGDTSWLSATSSFWGANNLVEASSEVANTGSVANMNNMMNGWSSMTSPPDLSSFDTSSVTNMSTMMYNWPSLTSPPDLSSFDTSSVTNMSSMLRAWTYIGAVDIAIDSWIVGSVTNFTNFLAGTQLTTACYDRTLASWGNQTLAAGASGQTIHFGTSQYTDEASHALLLAQVTNIIDGGLAP